MFFRCQLLAAALSLVAGAAHAADEVPLRYRFSPYQGPPVYTTGQKLSTGEKPDGPLRNVPRFRSAKPLYGAATLGRGGDTTISFALDESKGTGTGYDLLVIDRNNNNDLSDDPPVRAVYRRGARLFEPLPLLIRVDGKTRLYHAAIEGRVYGAPPGEPPPPPEYRLKSLGYYIGEARFDAKTYPVALVDYNANGLYGDPFRELYNPEKAGDMLLVDRNRNGRFEESGPIPREMLHCGKCIVVDGRFYELTTRADGSTLGVTPARVPLATVRSNYPRFSLMLASDDSLLTIEGKSSRARVPPGKYRVVAWNIEQQAPDGKWEIQGSGAARPDAKEPDLIVEKKSGASFRLPTPLVAEVGYTPMGPREFNFILSLTTASGQRVNNVLVNGRMPEEPVLRLLDETGNEVAKLKFHYG